ncbi:MAG: TraB/GumN family protein [Alphaproteobacteria bacterium]|nr:TraB/GumN family protein [Alphaproteobacteria bacterium]
MRKILLLVLLLAAPASADTIANPTLWHVKSGKGEVYLLGSVHILPPDVQWHSPALREAMARADVFVFEVSQDQASIAELQGLVKSHGFLPPDQRLSTLLRPDAKDDFAAALAASGVTLEQVDHDRPWLAGLQMMFAQIARAKFSPDNGVDASLMAEARAAGKPMRYLETIAQQFAVLAPDDTKLELEEFESSLKDLRDVAAEIQPLVTAWSAGDQKALDELLNGDLDEFPAARKALLDDRNARWLPQIRAMLKEKHVFLITVGAGHLTGAKGVPTLLRKAGYKVEGP